MMFLHLDAAHNKEAAIALREAIEILFPNQKIVSIISILKEKIIKVLSPS